MSAAIELRLCSSCGAKGHGSAPCRSLNIARARVAHLGVGRLVYVEDPPPRPQTRADCAAGPRPCPWASCRHHLLLDVDSANGTIKLNAASLAQQADSCALDVADRGGVSLEEVASLFGVTRERVRQIEERALQRIERIRGNPLRDHLEGHSSQQRPAAAPEKKPRRYAEPRAWPPELKREVLAQVDEAIGTRRPVAPILNRLRIEYSHIRAWRRQLAAGRL